MNIECRRNVFYLFLMHSQKVPNSLCRTRSGIQNMLNSLDSGLCLNDALKKFQNFDDIVI